LQGDSARKTSSKKKGRRGPSFQGTCSTSEKRENLKEKRRKASCGQKVKKESNWGRKKGGEDFVPMTSHEEGKGLVGRREGENTFVTLTVRRKEAYPQIRKRGWTYFSQGREEKKTIPGKERRRREPFLRVNRSR